MQDPIGVIGKDSWGDEEFRQDILVEALCKGELALVLGAGISKFLKLPLWHELIAGCARRAGLRSLAKGIDKNTAAEELRKAFDQISERCGRKKTPDILEIVSQALYQALSKKGNTYPSEVALSPLLIALGALTMNSSRGSVSEIISLNFDDLLEWFLDLHGFSTQVVTEYPTLLRADKDVRVFHPHGFLPLRRTAYQPSDFFVLSQKQYLATMADAGSSWSIALQNLLISKILLFVGTRVEDPDIHLHLTRAEPLLAKTRPFGYVLIQQAELTKKRADEIRRLNLEPFVVKSYRTAHFDLLRICQGAAERNRQLQS